MTGVTHGADAARLDEISGQLRVQGEQVGQIGETLGVVSGTLREAWSGPDMEHLLAHRPAAPGDRPHRGLPRGVGRRPARAGGPAGGRIGRCIRSRGSRRRGAGRWRRCASV